ncbi:MAG: hypothetical protein M1823_007060, partial [Watsoniomyces obsoletus]
KSASIWYRFGRVKTPSFNSKVNPSPMTLLAWSVWAELREDTIEFPLVKGGMASVAFVEAIESASSSDQTEEDAADWKALSRGMANMELRAQYQ